MDERLKQPIFANTAKIYAAPREVRPGQKLTVHWIANELREAGYTGDGAAQPSPLGTYSEGVQQITVQPGPQSYHAPDSATIHVSGGVVDSITDAHGQQLSSYELEPLLITGLSEGAQRTKRRLLTYDEIPPNLVHAVIAIEDRRFFEHSGIDYWRILGAMRNDIFHLHRYEEGASTLTQQLARGFFLTPERTYSRKMREAVISIILEHRFYQAADLRHVRQRDPSRAAAAAFPSTASARRRRPTSARMCASSTWPSALCSPGSSRAPAA